MPTRSEYLAESLRRIGSYRTLTVSTDPDLTAAAAQRRIVSTDLYGIDHSTPHLGQGFVWIGRYNEGNRIRTNSYSAVSQVILVPPTTSDYTLKIYGYGETATLTTASNAAAIQTAVRDVSSSLSNVTVSGSNPYTITLPSASITIELSRATPSDTTGSITQGLAQVEMIRPGSVGLPRGTTVVLSPKYPVHDDNGLVGAVTLINQALARLWFVDLLHFTSTDADSEQVTFEIATLYPWLQNRRQILRAYAPTSWDHTFSYTVPGSSHTLTMDLGVGTNYTTSSLSGSATASEIQTAIQGLISNAQVVGTVTVTANGTTRTVLVENAVYADMTLTVSTGATVTTTRERTESLRFIDGWRLKFNGEDRQIEWDTPIQRGYTWFLEVFRPAHTWVCAQEDYQTQGSTWASSMTGLSNDLDQAMPDVNEVAAVTHYLICRQLALFGPAQESKFWREEQSRAALIAAYTKSLDLPMSNEPGFSDEGLMAFRGSESKGFFN